MLIKSPPNLSCARHRFRELDNPRDNAHGGTARCSYYKLSFQQDSNGGSEYTWDMIQD